MKIATQLVAILALSVVAISAQEVTKQALRPGGVPKKGLPKMLNKKGPAPIKMMNAPNANVERLFAMTPEQRERVLEKMPPERQANLRKRFEQFDALPPEEKAHRLALLKQMDSLTPEKRELVQRQMTAVNELPTERALPVRRAINQLSKLTPEERKARLANPNFAGRFSAPELQMISDIVDNYSLPGK